MSTRAVTGGGSGVYQTFPPPFNNYCVLTRSTLSTVTATRAPRPCPPNPHFIRHFSIFRATAAPPPFAMIVAIEFDVKSGFETLESCQRWLSASAFNYMLKFRSFHLRRKRNGQWMCGEKRPVYAWCGDLWRYKGLLISRPEPGIVIVECGSTSGIFNPAELPPMLTETAQKLAEKEQKDVERKKQREEKRKLKKSKDKTSPPLQRKRKLEKDSEPKVKEEPKTLPPAKVQEYAEIYRVGSQDPDPLSLSPFPPSLL